MRPAANTAQSNTNPLAAIPREIADYLRPHFEGAIDEVTTEIQSSITEYARPDDPTYQHATRAAVTDALHAFLDQIGNPDPPNEELRERFRELGAGEAYEGRSLDSLQTALRTGAVTTWRLITELQLLEPLAFPRRYLGPIAESKFLFQQEMATAAMEGYNRVQARAVGELQRRRGRLLSLLLADTPPAAEAIAELARAAEWRLPTRISVVVLQSRTSDVTGAPVLPTDVLADFDRPDPCLVVPDPDGPGRLRSLGAVLHNWEAAAGPTVGVTQAAESYRRAQDTLALVCAGQLPRDGVVRWNDHLSTLLLFHDPELMTTMAEVRLAPLEELRPTQRDRMAETLLALLQQDFNAKEVASRLHLHPQTVRYRLRNLQRLFGERLRDPDERFELEMVLRARRMTAEAEEVGQHDARWHRSGPSVRSVHAGSPD
ncbi:DNA-binding NarL/FixJ family response regulator [Lipingzhangella halophila]|uniref:DNA-binding NarL/FixJ family response regulator n=1 Tax=Lipingzhangella halophila TaxID=1783352 RepID=A0A7W7W4E0_9ACTN|nr:PucR family transcriptional regulator [Lipingzhangella halophila]MBB4933691.1 DNA-binding NarL/FixJ family response regulator [Lipingzhangella halophila]